MEEAKKPSTELFPKSLLQMISQSISEEAMALNLLQVMEKERMESVGRNCRIEKMWSWAMLVMEDLLLLLVSAMAALLLLLRLFFSSPCVCGCGCSVEEFM